MWATKHEDIANEIRDLGLDYSQKLLDWWIHYLEEKNAAGRFGQTSRVDVSTRERVVDDSE